MKNAEIASIFDTMASLLELLGENVFRIRSYGNAARAVGDLSEDIEKVCAAGKLKDIPGIGESMAAKIGEYCATGKIARYEELRTKLPAELPQLLTLPGLGPKTISKLWKQAKITSLNDLRECLAGDRDRLRQIEGLGEKKIRQLADSLAFVESTGNRLRLGEATGIARSLIEQIAKAGAAHDVVAAGSLRRGRETVGDIDLLCTAAKSAAGKVIDRFCSAPPVQKVLAKGQTKGSVVLKGGIQADLRVVQRESYGAALMYFTGSKAHNVMLRERAIKRGLKLNEYGLLRGKTTVAGEDEQSVYRALGLPCIPPELREGRGEIEAAGKGKLPALVEARHIRGDFQMHTKYSDGLSTIPEMLAACRDLGYRVLAITDHSQSQHQAGGMDKKKLFEQVEVIHNARAKFPDMLVLAGCEVDILKDGRLDFEDDVLARLDFVLAAPHAALNQTGAEATKRLIKAVSNPFVHCIGHPTGRLINGRPGMEIDIDALAEAAAEHDVALEVNADWSRLDLRDTHVRSAIHKGARIMINTDAHSTASLGTMMPYGVTTARRGWATKADVINTWPLAKIKAWLERHAS